MRMVDAHGRCHTFVDKTSNLPDVDLDVNSRYPQPGTIRCTVVDRWRDDCARRLVGVNSAIPDHLESTDEVSEFVLLQAQTGSEIGPP